MLLVVGGGWFVLAPGVARASDHELLGAERCASCHEAEAEAWRKDPHRRALEKLTSKEQRDPTCTVCHSTKQQMDVERGSLGVECESCHGAGRRYAPAYIMRDPRLARLLGLEKISPKTCTQCHNRHAPHPVRFDFAKWAPRVSHGHEVKWLLSVTTKAEKR